MEMDYLFILLGMLAALTVVCLIAVVIILKETREELSIEIELLKNNDRTNTKAICSLFDKYDYEMKMVQHMEDRINEFHTKLKGKK